MREQLSKTRLFPSPVILLAKLQSMLKQRYHIAPKLRHATLLACHRIYVFICGGAVAVHYPGHCGQKLVGIRLQDAPSVSPDSAHRMPAIMTHSKDKKVPRRPEGVI